MVLKLSENSHT